MDYKNIVECLNARSVMPMDDGDMGMMQVAAKAITVLLARAEEAEAEIEQKEKYYSQMVDALAATDSMELTEAKRKLAAAVSDLETIMAYGTGNLDTCIFCKNAQCYARGGTKPCLPKWRGTEEE